MYAITLESGEQFLRATDVVAVVRNRSKTVLEAANAVPKDEKLRYGTTEDYITAIALYTVAEELSALADDMDTAAIVHATENANEKDELR